MGFLSKLLGLGSKVDLVELERNGALIIDVRNPGEYKNGHIKGSINIPLQELKSKINDLKKDQVIITCCLSGMRSKSAQKALRDAGFEAHNGGGWSSLNNKLQ